jgi:hypothetical protein
LALPAEGDCKPESPGPGLYPPGVPPEAMVMPRGPWLRTYETGKRGGRVFMVPVALG